MVQSVEHSSGVVRTACDILVVRLCVSERTKIMWKKLTENGNVWLL